jgi:Flp pilus assembly protein TadG
VDLGIVYSAQSQLQSAADSAALAAAAELVTDERRRYRTPTMRAAENTAHNYVEANTLLENQLVWTAADKFEAGFWDFRCQGLFTLKGDSANPDDLNAARVTLARTVDTFSPASGNQRC